MLPATDDYPWTLNGAPLGDVWFLTLYASMSGSGGTPPSFEFTSDYSLTDPMNFSFTGETESPASGYYLMFLAVGDTETDPENFKLVTAIAHYSDSRGLSVETLSETPVAERLAETGGDPNAFIWAILGGLVVLAAVVLRPKRRTQDGSTSEPSDEKE
jgi:hypothetical protein